METIIRPLVAHIASIPVSHLVAGIQQCIPHIDTSPYGSISSMQGERGGGPSPKGRVRIAINSLVDLLLFQSVSYARLLFSVFFFPSTLE